MPGRRAYSASRFALLLDGVESGWLNSMGGGSAEADVVEETTNQYYAKKHLGPLKYEPLTIRVGLPFSKVLQEWLSGFLSGKALRKDGKIIAVDNAIRSVSETEFYNASISELTFPPLDASSKEPGYITIKIAPEYTRRVKGSGKKLTLKMPAQQKVWRSSNFRLQIGGLDCSRVSKIDSITIKESTVSDEIGEVRDYLKEPGKLEFPNLKITLAANSAQSWVDWHEDFVIKGNNGDDKEKSGSIAFLAQDLKTELARMTLSNIGIFKLATTESEAMSAGKVSASLYCELIAF